MPNVNEKLTFGLELEGVMASARSAEIALHRNFIKRYDHSIRADDGSPLPRTVEEGGGFEYITPVLSVGVRMSNVGDNLTIDVGDSVNVVQALCDCINHVNISCGVHVHLGRPKSEEEWATSRWEPERVRTMLTIGMMLENKIFDVMPESRRGNHHCATIGARYSENDLGQFYPTGNVVARKFDNIKRYCWMNLIETRRVGTEDRPGRGASPALGTIEVRCLGNTAYFLYVWTWTRLLIKLASYVAYLPSSLAILRCGMMSSFDEDFEALAKLKATVVENAVPMAEPPTISVDPNSMAESARSSQTLDVDTAISNIIRTSRSDRLTERMARASRERNANFLEAQSRMREAHSSNRDAQNPIEDEPAQNG